jgi:hypothetical protein
MGRWIAFPFSSHGSDPRAAGPYRRYRAISGVPATRHSLLASFFWHNRAEVWQDRPSAFFAL